MPAVPPVETHLAQAATRKLMAVLHIDMVGYSRLIGLDDFATVARLRRLRAEIIEVEVARHDGRIRQTAGDSLLMTFGSVTAAAACAIAIQRRIPLMESVEPPDRRIRFRAGIDIGDVIADGADLHGTGVNIAARLQALCPVGDVCISRSVYDRVHDDVAVPIVPLGALTLKNIAARIEAFVLRVAGTEPVTAVPAADAADGDDERVAARLGPRLQEPSIAVLPFRTLSGKPTDRYFADGIVEDIIHSLASLKELLVISRGSTIRYAGNDIDTARVARDLDVRYILHGSVRRSAGALRIRTELTDTGDMRVIRSDQYDGAAASLFSLQEQIAVQVASSVVPQVRAQELRRAMRKPPSNLTAYDLVLQALDALFRVTYQPFLKAREMLREAIMLDPDYAPAYTYAAYACIFNVGEGWSPDPGAEAREAAAFATQAIERDPNDPVALAIYGHVQSFLLHDYGTGVAFLDRAIEAGPSCALAWTMSSATCGYLGQGALAVERARLGLRHSPLDTRVFWPEAILGQAHYVSGDCEQAVTWAEKALAHAPTAVFNLRTLAASHAALGHTMEARSAAARLLRIQPGFRLAAYAPNCPFRGDILATWLERLHQAGLPA